MNSKVSHFRVPRGRGHSRGFTLIELLIVVSIISILAAIAVPNFLEAQTRAKVAKSVSNQRTASLALEMYALDNIEYPPWYMVWGGWHWAGLPNWLLTSPVAYISTDVSLTDEFSGFEVYSWYRLKSPGTACWNEGNCSVDCQVSSADCFDLRKQSFLAIPGRGCPPGAHYCIVGAGPTLRVLDPPGYDSPQYDSSNGTVSEGKIYRYGP